MNWNGLGGPSLVSRLKEILGEDPFWAAYAAEHIRGHRIGQALHVAVFHEPFLSWVLEGRKRVESRFSQHQVAPFGNVEAGDAVLLKRVAGPLVGICHVNAAWSYHLDASSWASIRDRFAVLLCAEDDEFWSSRREARYATLISIEHVRALPDIEYPKSDRRGWVVELDRVVQHSLSL